MATNKLIQLPEFSYTSLDFDTIIEDVKTLVKQHPEYNALWSDFLESNSGLLFTEVMSFLIEKLANRVDWVVQEMFISTATQKQSLINLLKLINHRPYLPSAAKVNVKGKVTKWTSPFNLPLRETITGLDTNGNAIKFECIEMSDDGKPNYFYNHYINTGTQTNRVYEFTIPFYQGTTYTEDSIYMEGVDNESFVLDNYPVIENSIRVYIYESNTECPEVTSFISPDAQQIDLTEAEKVPPYMVEIDSLNKATIKWGSSSLVKTPSRGQRIKVMYRVGGGAKTNIVAGAINTTKTYAVDGDTRITILYTNPERGFGGSDEENMDEAKLIAPISLRSAEKTVTDEDYIVHIEKSPLVMHANIVGKDNEPEDIYAEYGYFLPPLDTWIYACPKRDNYNSIDPFYYNKFLKIDAPYNQHKVLDSETISFTTLIQKAYLKKIRRYLGYSLYIIPSDNYLANPYNENVDYTFDMITGSITRISTADGGTIPAGDTTLLVNYVSDSTATEFKTNTVLAFGTNDRLYLDAVANSIYPKDEIIVKNALGTVGRLNVDYTINYENNYLTRISGGLFISQETVFVQYSNNWVQDDNDDSEESLILSSIKNKKMICVDNILKESVYTTFDLVATVYCYKNLRSSVETNLKNNLREKYNILTSEYNKPISKAKITSDIMALPGVRYVDVDYLGKNYEAYRRFLLDSISLDELNEMDANKVDNSIIAKYNEILVLAWDHYEGLSQNTESQRSGLIFTFKDA